MNTYEISKEYEALRSLKLDEEFDEVTGELIDNSKELKQLFDEIDLKRDDKLKGIEYIKREYQSINSTIDLEIKRLQDRKKKFDAKVEKLQGLQVYLLGGEKVETDLFTFSFRKSTETNIDEVDVLDVDAKFLNTKTVVTLDKKLIKQAILSGEDVIGAKLVDKYSLQVK